VLRPRRTTKERTVIKLTRVNHQEFFLNAELVLMMESTPDTIITLTTGQKLMVVESVDEVVSRIIGYKRSVFLNPTVERRTDSSPPGARNVPEEGT
jgi:flagellar protein FlbD